MSDSHLPYVFILDWDGTIVGKVDFQSARHTMTKTMTKYGYRVNQKAIPRAFHPNEGLVRPGFSGFIKGIRQMYPNCAIFIFTASERQWALQEISWVERTHGIQFQRPIFTRDDCTTDTVGNYRKSIGNIWARILRSITSKTGTPYQKEERDNILNERTIIIDNNAVYTDRHDRLLLCPDYNYMVFEDLLDGFPDNAFKHPGVQQQVLHLVNEGLVCPHSINNRIPSANAPSHSHFGAGVPANHQAVIIKDPMTQMAKQYEWYAQRCKIIMDMNKRHKSDIFWIYLLKLIQKNNLRVYTKSILQQLQGAVWKRMRKIALTSES